MNADVARVAELFRSNGVMSDAAFGQAFAAAGGQTANVHDLVAAFARVRTPWAPSVVGGVTEPHIHACLIAAAQGTELPYPGLRVGQSLILRPLDFTGRKPRFMGVEFDARVPAPSAPPFTYLKLAFESDIAKLTRETQLVSAIQQTRCAGTASVRESTSGGGTSLLTTQLLPGRDLSIVVGSEGALPAKTVINVALRLLATLAGLNGAGFYHRNLHPSHIVVDGELAGACHIGLVGWSLGRQLDEPESEDPFFQSSTTPPQLRYPESLAYWPPEQRSPVPGTTLMEACDVYGFGAVMFYMLTGRPPAEMGASCVAAAKLPAELSQLLEALLAPNPAERPSLLEVAEKLVEIDQKTAASEPPTQSATPKAPSPSGPVSHPQRSTKSTPVAKPSTSAAAAPQPMKLPEPSRQRPPVAPASGSRSAASYEDKAKKPATKARKTPAVPPKRSFNPDDTVAIRTDADDTKVEIRKGATKKDRGGELRGIDSERTEPRVMIDDPLNLNLAATASIAKLSSDILRVHWPETSSDQRAFLRQLNGSLERLTDPSLIDQAERQSGFGKDKAAVGNDAEAVPLLLSAWQCLPSSREHYERLLKGRDQLAAKKKSVLKKAFGAAVKFNPARIRPVYQLIQAGNLIPALTEADKLYVAAPNDGRSLWAMGIAADLLEAWPLCELVLGRLWDMPNCGGADPVAVAAARVKLLMVRGDVEDTPAMMSDLEDVCRENGVSPKFFDKFTRTIATDAHSRRYRRREQARS